MEKGVRQPSQFKMGAEHEKFPFYTKGLKPVPYAPDGIRALLEGLAGLTGWQVILEGGNPIGLFDPNGSGAVSLEPAGQFELSGAPQPDAHGIAAETLTHLRLLKQVAEPLGIQFLAQGSSPVWPRAETPVMPKSRYRIMMNYMPKVGGRGLDMMQRTCTTHVNFDFSSEADMVKKMRVGLSLTPLIIALFANSPFMDGRKTGYLSWRSDIWRDTDNARSGILPFAFEPGMGFERYVDYALDVPMYFIKRGDTYHDVAGTPFRHLLEGKAAAMPGERAVLSDWINHLGTIFPEVRLKRYLELRGADVGPPDMIAALPAFWAGILYHPASLDAAWNLVKGWSQQDRQLLRDDAPRIGLKAAVKGLTLQQLAKEVLALSRAGLTARARLDAQGRDESRYLAPLDAIAASGITQAEATLAAFDGVWKGSFEKLFAANTY